MDRKGATAEIKKIFGAYKRLTRNDVALIKALKDGKLYELHCLVCVLKVLRNMYGYNIRFIGRNIEFQSSPGFIDKSKAHFEILDDLYQVRFELYTDIEFLTLSSKSGYMDRSSYHEVDIVVVDANVIDRSRPSYESIALAVECKAHAVVRKATIKEVLGVRSELGIPSYIQQTKISMFSSKRFPVGVPFHPPSEYWLMHLHPDISEYSEGPSTKVIYVFHYPCN